MGLGKDRIKDYRFWASSKGQILNEALEDGLKEGLRERVKSDRIKKYFEEDSKIVVGALVDKKYPPLSLLSFQLEQYGLLMIVLASLGFLTKDEVILTSKYFESRYKILSLSENKSRYISIMVKEASLVPVLNQIQKGVIIFQGFSGKTDDPDPIAGKRSSYSTDNKDILGMTYINDDLNEFAEKYLADIDMATYIFYSRHYNCLYYEPEMSAKHLAIYKTIFNVENRDGDICNILLITCDIKIYSIASMDYGVFLESNLYFKNEDSSVEMRTGLFFLAFTPHFHGKSVIATLSSTPKTVSSFYNSDFSAKIYPEHTSEQALLAQISG